MNAYARPTDLAEALRLAQQGHRILAGGTDVYAGGVPVRAVLDLTAIADLRGISTGPGLRIGAATTWTALAEAGLPPALTALQQAARQIGGRQIQNAGTIGGNLCNASPAADGIPPLLVLDAEVELSSVGAVRVEPLSRFLLGPRRVDLRPGEIMTALLIRQSALSGRSTFAKLGARSHLVISIAMVALRLVSLDGRITHASAAVGACSASAQRLPLLEAALLGAPLADAASLITRDHLAPLSPIDDVRASAAYRREAALELLRRAVAELAT